MAEALVISEEMLDKRIDFERHMPRVAVFSLIFIGLNILMFIGEIIFGSLTSMEAIIASGALYRPLVLKGEWWRIISAMFLHGSLGHLLGNCIVLYILGMICEYVYKSWQFVVLYFAAGITGGILSLVFHSKPSVGASGAIFGLLSCSAIFFYKYKDRLILKNKRIGLVLLFWAVYEIFTGFLVPYVDNFAHIGGAIGGVLVGNALMPKIFDDSKT